MTIKKILTLWVLVLLFNPVFSQEPPVDIENYSLFPHESQISAICFSNDKKIMATVSDSTIIIWKLGIIEGDTPLKTGMFKDKADINSICFTENDEYLVSAGYSQEIILWDYKKGEKVKSFKMRYTQDEVDAMKSRESNEISRNQWESARSSRSSRYSSRSSTSSGRDFSKFEKKETGSFPSIIYSIVSYKNNIFSAHSDNTIKQWEISSDYGKMETIGRNSQWHKWNVNHLELSDRGTSLYSASDDNLIKKWSVSYSTSYRQDIKGHTKSVIKIVGSPGSKYLASISKDRSMRIWSKSGTEVCGVISEQNRINDIAFSEHGKYLVTAEQNHFYLWTLSEEGKLSYVGNFDAFNGAEVTSVAFKPGSKDNIEVITGSEDGALKAWDAKILIVRNYFADEYKKEKEKSNLFKPKGEFEKTSEYLKRKQKAKGFLMNLDREYSKKYAEIEEEIGEEPKPDVVTKDVYLKIQHISKYNADNEFFEITIKGVTKKVVVPIKYAPDFKKYYTKAKVKGIEYTSEGKSEIKSISITDYKSKKIFPFGDLNEDKVNNK